MHRPANSSLESVIEQSKQRYYLALRQTQVTIRTDRPNWRPRVIDVLRALQRQQSRRAAKIEREQLILDDLPELSAAILQMAREQCRGCAASRRDTHRIALDLLLRHSAR